MGDAPELKPCPFCGGAMEDRGYGALHLDGQGCPIGDLAIDKVRWNRRADAQVRAHPKVRALVEALQGLEWACEQLAATRTQEVYLAMVGSGQTEALLSLDARRRTARAALRDLVAP